MAKQPRLSTLESQAVQPVERPIICSPYDWPDSHWAYSREDGKAYRADYRRPAGYYYKTELTGVQGDLFAEEERDDLPLVNALRNDVDRWRKSGYRGASAVTKQLLDHWSSSAMPQPLFFCQREAVETLIYLCEFGIPGQLRSTGFQKFELSEPDLKHLLRGEKPSFPTALPDFFPTLIDQPENPEWAPLTRMAAKMATGSGKTVVMAMMIAWAFCNRHRNPSSDQYPRAVLVCCPNLTVKERLQVLRPELPGNYFDEFEIVPAPLRSALSAGKVMVQNWHGFAEESAHKEGDRTYAVVDKGSESADDVARRVLGDLYDHMPIMVLNDEGHHCWRPRPVDASATKGMTSEEKQDLEKEKVEARVWLAGLDRINNAFGPGRQGIRYCIDLSATPFFIQGSGYPEGRPFPWIVSDFGLMDAIESGIVKIPRIPIADDTRKRDEIGRPDPKYFRLWRNIVDGAPANQKRAGGKPKAEYVFQQAQGALTQIAGQWLERFRAYQETLPRQDAIPPVLIIVCDNVEIAEVFFRHISGESEEEAVTEQDVDDVLGEGEEDSQEDAASTRMAKKPKKRTVYGTGTVFPEHLSNTKDRKYTIRIDSKLLAEAESDDDNKTKQKLAEELRRIVATVGKKGQPGEHVRCVVSVGMLTEGWDANNVTNILGVRAFGSQLLCEQVVGRGLRRMSYEPEWDEAEGKLLLPPEYVDVYGIPFSVIPYKGKDPKKVDPVDRLSHKVYGMPDREEYEIRFPDVENYVFELNRPSIVCDVASIEKLTVTAKLEPLETFVMPTLGVTDGAVRSTQASIIHDRQAFYDSTHPQEMLFKLSKVIVDDLLAGASNDDKKARVLRLQARHQLFPQVFRIVEEYVDTRVDLQGCDPRELALDKYMQLLRIRIRDSIRPAEHLGEVPLLPVLNRYSPVNSTAKVNFVTRCPVMPTTKSQINLVVAHSQWEHEAAEILEELECVAAYARNEKLYLTIPYEWEGETHGYIPDFVVMLQSGLQVVLEIKGSEHYEPERDPQKQTAARKWVDAVNNLGDFGQWQYMVCRDLNILRNTLEALAGSQQAIELTSA